MHAANSEANAAAIIATCSVVITRPEAQAEPWAEQLAAQGFSTARMCLLELAPVTTETQIRAIKNKILDFDLYQKAIFVSQNAVDYGMAWLEDYWPQLPVRTEYFVVGATTAKKLASYGVRVQDLAVSETGGMTSEDLLRAPHLQQLNGEKILIFRGCGGRNYLAEELRRRGATVDFCELYERRLPIDAKQQLVQLMASDALRPQCVISLHSGASVENLLALLMQFAPSDQQEVRHFLQQAIMLVPSKRVEQETQSAGFLRTLCAENATDVAMTTALLNYFRTDTCISLQD